jgi:hypothetical protein
VSTDNVTPIRPPSGPPPPAKPPRRARKPRSPRYLTLRRQDLRRGLSVNEAFETVEAVYGLRGVCQALQLASEELDSVRARTAAERRAKYRDNERVWDLAMAAKVLAEIVADRVEE